MMSCLSPPATAPLTGPADVEGLPESVKQATWFITRQLFFVDLALPLQPDMEQVEDEDAMYAQLLKQPVDTDNRPTLCANNACHLAGGSSSFSSTGLFLCVA